MDNRTHFLQTFVSALFRPRRLRTTIRLALLCAIAVPAMSLSSPAAHAQAYAKQTVYDFGSASTGNGAFPQASLILVNGLLYGTTQSGGAYGTGTSGGTVFSLDPKSGAEKILHSFGGTSSDGSYPLASLITLNGLLYGTTHDGGTDGDGTLFSVDPTTGAEKIVYSFTGHPNDGAGPHGLLDVGGVLYGTTDAGGSSGNGNGTLFSMDLTTHVEKILHSFDAGNGIDGYRPEAALIDVNGVLYGSTYFGGTGNFNSGTVFSINPNGTNYQVLYRFGTNGSSDGSVPLAPLLDVNGVLYGTTNDGGTGNGNGTIFAIDLTTGAEKIVYNFSGGTDGRFPQAGLIAINGLLYGATQSGTNSSGAGTEGTVFSFDPSAQTMKTLYTFSNQNGDGQDPLSNLLDVGGTLYGTTSGGGVDGKGTVFSLTPIVAPVAANDKYAVKYSTPFAIKAPGVLGNDNAGHSLSLTATLVTQVAHGTLAFKSDGSFSYTPSPGFVGTDTFTYQAGNAAGKSNTATVSLVVQAVVPVAHNDAYAPIYSHAYKVNAPGVLGNDYAGDTGSLTAKLVSTVSHGTLTLNSDGSFLYSPTFEYSGTDSFTYTATNAIGTSNTATVTFTINPVVPIAHNDTYAPKYATAYGVSASGVLGNDDDGGTSPMTAALVANVTHGTLTFNSNGSFTYTPSAGFIGTDSFTYQDTTPTGTGNTATVTLNVTAAVPVAHNDSYTVAHNKAYAVKAPGVLGNDYNGDTGTLTAKLGTTTSHGILTFNTDGSFNYTPATGFTGTDAFTYQATNAIGTSNTATVTLTVQ